MPCWQLNGLSVCKSTRDVMSSMIMLLPDSKDINTPYPVTRVNCRAPNRCAPALPRNTGHHIATRTNSSPQPRTHHALQGAPTCRTVNTLSQLTSHNHSQNKISTANVQSTPCRCKRAAHRAAYAAAAAATHQHLVTQPQLHLPF